MNEDKAREAKREALYAVLRAFGYTTHQQSYELADAALQWAASQQAAEGWRPIETAPKDGRTILLGYFNSHGKWRTMRGQWMSEDYIAEYWEEPEMGGPGWYETVVEHDEVPNCWWTEPTHWRPLPAPPSTQGGADEQR